MFSLVENSVLINHQVSEFTKILMDQVQFIALAFMAIVYMIKLWWLFKFKPGKEGTPAFGDESKSILYAYMTLAMPWEMESTSKHWFRYLEFVIFHIGAAIAIFATFVLPYVPQLLAPKIIILGMQVILALAFLAGISRLIRRITVPEMRLISSPDDYFSIITLNVWLVTTFFGVQQTSESWLIAFFSTTTFFLIYVPFSKISHYLYWPFMRYYMGKHFGHRGVYPKKRIKASA